MGKNFREFHVLEKNYTQKTKFYMVHTLFLTDSRKFNPAKYTIYTVRNQEEYDSTDDTISRVRETQRGRKMIQVEKRTENSVGLQAGQARIFSNLPLA